MNNGHLPAGRAAAHGAGAGPGAADVAAEPRPVASVGNGGGGGGGGGSGGRNSEGGNGGGRPGGGRRGRHYGSHYNQHHGHTQYGQHGPHGQHGQHGQPAQYGQHAMYPGYMHPYASQQYGFPPMPYMQNGVMPNAYVPFQQPYGRPGAGMPAPFTPGMAAPLGLNPLAPPAIPHHHQQPHVPLSPYQQHPLQQPQQHPPPPPHLQQQPPPLPPPPPHVSPPYARNAQQVPLVVSTPQPSEAQMPPPPPPPYHGTPSGYPPPQSPPAAPAMSYPQMPPLPASAALPPSLPPHIPIPPRDDAVYSFAKLSFSNPSQQPPNPPATPSSSLSSHAMATPLSAASVQPKEVPTPDGNTGTPSSDAELTPTSAVAPTASSTTETSDSADAASEHAAKAPAFSYPLPWSSRPDIPFPKRSAKPRRPRRGLDDVENVELPPNAHTVTASSSASTASTTSATPTAAAAAPIVPPQTPEAPAALTSPLASATTPTPAKQSVASPTSTNGSISRTLIPALPVIPARTATASKPSDAKAANAAGADTAKAEQPSAVVPDGAATADGKATAPAPASVEGADKATATAPPAPQPPKLWTGLFSKSSSAAGGVQGSGLNGGAATNGHAVNGTNGTGAFSKANANSLAEAVASYRVGSSSKVAFIEPRGLINTGNMCYMNSVLQVLTFCIPFYDFLDQVSQKAAFSFKSETPMIDAMIMFLREFKVIDRADPTDLQRRLKHDDLERYGEAFTPEFVYEAINKLARFSTMIRGHQQDAEEFLGFLLESLNEECTKVMQDAANASDPSTTPNSAQETPAASVTSEVPDASGSGWLEVGRRQRAAVTRSSGHVSTSPVYSIFGGLLRSELRVPGRKDSVTLEPYQSLQLHIDSPEVRNIVDALRGLTNPEILHDDFKSPQGKDVRATKQVFIEDLPPVLILHLKRFQYDWQGSGAVKIWKKVGYPLELEIPREIFSRRKRNTFLSEPLPKYRLNAVVYHHGKMASGGHYTVDVLREDGREWIRLDDTVIRRIRREDVAEAGAEEPGPSASRPDGPNNANSATAAAGRTAPVPAGGNRFAGMSDDEERNEVEGESGWSAPVNGSGKKWSAVANSTAAAGTPGQANKAKQVKDDAKDKVAYLLFYQRLN